MIFIVMDETCNEISEVLEGRHCALKCWQAWHDQQFGKEPTNLVLESSKDPKKIVETILFPPEEQVEWEKNMIIRLNELLEEYGCNSIGELQVLILCKHYKFRKLDYTLM